MKQQPVPTFFPSAAEFRAWLIEHHASASELWVGFHRKSTGRPSITWPEAVDQALCFGWIDGIRKSIDAERYTNRFTPRRPGSNWSRVNVERVRELTASGLMQPAGERAFAARTDARIGRYSYENRPTALEPELEERFRANAKAWQFFEEQPPGYRRTAIYWVMDAKLEATRLRRLATLVADSGSGRRLALLTPPAKR